MKITAVETHIIRIIAPNGGSAGATVGDIQRIIDGTKVPCMVMVPAAGIDTAIIGAKEIRPGFIIEICRHPFKPATPHELLHAAEAVVGWLMSRGYLSSCMIQTPQWTRVYEGTVD